MLKVDCALLIDDDGITNSINYKIVKKLNLANEIQVVESGDKAIQFIIQYAFQRNNKSPELLLVDLNMSGTDGFDFVQTFKKMELTNKGKVKIIILTTSTHPKDLKIIKKEALGYINKPLTVEKLQAALTISEENNK